MEQYINETVDNLAILYYYNSTIMDKKNEAVAKGEVTMFPIKISIDNRSAVPIYQQIKQAIKLSIISGELQNGDQLPSIRDLALHVKVNPNTIVKVYYQLDSEKFVYSAPGSGYFVDYNPSDTREDQRDIFQRISEEYIGKALGLGYSIQDIIDEMKQRIIELET